MICYRVINDFKLVTRDEGAIAYFPTLSAAHDHARAEVPRSVVYVETVLVPTDKASLLEILNGESCRLPPRMVVETYRMTPRGGLKRDPTLVAGE